MEGPLSTRQQFGELWAIRDFRALLLSRIVSNVGNGMAPVALAFGVLDMPDGDAGSLSIVTGAHMVPLVLFMLVGGAVADRFGRARLVGSCDIIGSLFVAVSALSFLTDHPSIPLLAFNGFVFGILNAIWYPAFTGLTPQVVPKDRLQSANAVIGLGANLALTIGSAVAGIVVASVGAGWAIMVDAASFFVAGCLVFSLRHLDRQPREPGESNHSLVTEMKEGWAEFSSRFWIVICVVSFAFFHPAFEGFLAVIAPVQVKETMGGSRDMGFMLAGWGLGGLLGTLIVFRFHVRRPLLLAVGVMPVVSLWIFSLVFPAPLIVTILAAVAAGTAIDVFYANWLTTLQTHVPEESMSRVGAYDAFGSLVLAPVGLFAAGPFVHAVGTRPALMTAGLIALTATLVPLMSSQVRSLERRDTEPTIL